jgi:radical SAM protein with 4Fe4S-binding SPASM domain
MDAAIHDEITMVKGSFEKTKAALSKLLEHDIPVQISCPIMKQNKNGFIDVLRWAHEHKIKVNADPVLMARFDHSTDNLDNRISIDDAGDILRHLLEYDVEYSQMILETDFSAAERYDRGNDTVCGVGITSCCMVANGNIYPCPGWQDYIIGNIREQSLLAIWENSPKIKYLRSLRKRDFPHCIKCESLAFCEMCLAGNYNESADGDIFSVREHFCKVAALNRKIVMDWKEKQGRVAG